MSAGLRVLGIFLAAVQGIGSSNCGTSALAGDVTTPAKNQTQSTSTTLPEDAAYMIALPRLGIFPDSTQDLSAEPWMQSARLAGMLAADNHRPIAYPTWIYLFYDQKSLWVALRCEGRNGEVLKRESSERDDKVWRDDSVEIKIQPGGDGSSLFHFIINSAGALFDSRGGDATWNGKLSIHTSIDATGWSAIVGMPFASLSVREPAPGTVWKANFFRNIPGGTTDPPSRTPTTTTRGCWCPPWAINGAVQEFGCIQFAAQNIRALRIHSISSIFMGENTLSFDPLPGLQLTLMGLGARGEHISQPHTVITSHGTARFLLTDDRVRKVQMTCKDSQGHLLGEAVYPMLSPKIRDRIEPLSERVETIRRELSHFSPKARRLADELLGQIDDPLSAAKKKVADPGHTSPKEWQSLSEAVTEWSLKLDPPSNLARTLERLSQAGFAIGWETPMQKVMISGDPFTGWFDDHYDLALARNEHEGCQLVVMPFEEDLRSVTVISSPLQTKDGKVAAGGSITVSLVGHVKVEGKQPYEVDRNGWYPDPLLSFQKQCDIKANDHVAFWIDVATDKNTPAGEYTATVTVSANDRKPISLKLNVKVWDFALPDGTHLRNAFTYHEPAVGRFYGGRWNQEMRYKYYDFLLQHRLNIDNIYRGERPALEVIRYGVEHGMNAFNVGSNFFDAGKDRKALRERTQFLGQLAKENLLQLAYVYGFDEVKEARFSELREAFDRVHRLFPGLKTMTTAQDKSFGAKSGLGHAVDIWVPTTDRYDPSAAGQLRSAGKEMWWYICIVPVHPYANWFVEYPAIEARLLTGAMSYKYRTDGFLYYLLNAWDKNHSVVGPGPYTNWNPASFFKEETGAIGYGDGSLFCPGPDGPISTVRMENLRDGFEDYEYLWLLQDCVRQLRTNPITPAISDFLLRADRLLAIPNRVVRSVVDFTENPGDLASYRADLAAAIIEGQTLQK